MDIINISRKAQKILRERGIDELKKVLDFTPGALKAFRIPLNDLSSLRSQLEERFSRRHILQKGWSKAVFRRLQEGNRSKGDSIFPPGTDEGVVKRFIHSTTTGKHYKKPRKRGLF